MLGSALARLNCIESICFAFTRLSGKKFDSFNLKPIKADGVKFSLGGGGFWTFLVILRLAWQIQ